MPRLLLTEWFASLTREERVGALCWAGFILYLLAGALAR